MHVYTLYFHSTLGYNLTDIAITSSIHSRKIMKRLELDHTAVTKWTNEFTEKQLVPITSICV